MSHAHLFAFENDFVVTLRCIPMAVRFKLDRAGVKLALRQWSRFTTEDRRALLLARCDGAAEVAAYRAHLIALLQDRVGQEPAPLPPNSTVAWDQASETPTQVRAFADSQGVQAPSDRVWGQLSTLQRFVLLKLSLDNHDNVNFVPALREFGLLQPAAAADREASYAASS